jgi:hypothetical protein
VFAVRPPFATPIHRIFFKKASENSAMDEGRGGAYIYFHDVLYCDFRIYCTKQRNVTGESISIAGDYQCNPPRSDLKNGR